MPKLRIRINVVIINFVLLLDNVLALILHNADIHRDL